MRRLRSEWTVVLDGAPSSGKSKLLVPLAERLGLPWDGGSVLKLTIDGVPVTVAVESDEGAELGVSFSAELPREPRVPPFLTVRRESAADRADKAAGLARETQLHAGSLDALVYVDSDARPEEVRRVLGSEDVRGAVTWLLEVDPRGAHFGNYRVAFSLQKPEPDSSGALLVTALEALVHLARTGGPRGERLRRRGVWLQVAAMVATPLALVAHVLAAWHFGAGACFGAMLWLAFGALGWLGTRGLVRRLVAGDSGSGVRARVTNALLFVVSGSLGLAATLVVNASSSAPPGVTVGDVITVRGYDEEENEWPLTVRWPTGVEEDLRVNARRAPGGGPKPGHELVFTRHPGRLGFDWGESYAVRVRASVTP